MTLEPQEQFKNFLEKSQDILILIPENPSGDAVGSAWALYFFIEKLRKRATVAFSDHLSQKFDFLPRPENIRSSVDGSRDFVLSFNITRNKITNVRTEEVDGKLLNIHLTPEKGSLDPRDFSFILAKFKYDLVIVLDSQDLERLGKIYEDHPDLFFEVPIVNIDYRSTNENFGQINIIDVTASSCSEIVYSLLENIKPDIIEKVIADSLLAGIISATDSFQKKNTTPKAFLASAALMGKGADQQEIVRWLYKNQPLHILKLWGRAMSKIRWEEKARLAWAELTVEDFVQSRATDKDIFPILDKLKENYSEGKIFMIVYNDTPSSAVAILKSELEIIKKLHPFIDGAQRNDHLEIRINLSSLREAGEIILKKIKEVGI